MSPSIERAVIDRSAPVSEPGTIRALVHKRFPENVLLTGIRACADDRFICAGRIPTTHPLFNEPGRTPREDILFYTEVGRQASLAVTHAYLNVGLDEVFIFERSEAAITDAIWRLPAAADTVEIEITIRETVRRKNAVTRVIADHSMTVCGERVFTGTGRWTIQSAAIFKRLRRGSAEASAPDWSPPRTAAASNRVIAPLTANADGAVGSSLIVDTTHPFFFDHACDHVPGMLLLEGFAQLALGACAASGAGSPRMTVMAYDADFTQFVECTLPISLTARLGTGSASNPNAPLTSEIVVGQRDVVAGTARVRVGVPV